MRNKITHEKLIKLGFSHTEEEDKTQSPFTDKYTLGNIIVIKNKNLSNLSHAICYQQKDTETEKTSLIIFKWVTSINIIKNLIKLLTP
jgi:hypothetical protein